VSVRVDCCSQTAQTRDAVLPASDTEIALAPAAGGARLRSSRAECRPLSISYTDSAPVFVTTAASGPDGARLGDVDAVALGVVAVGDAVGRFAPARQPVVTATQARTVQPIVVRLVT
jgi:hypothetical protein